jgi:catechol 2,3-dioxygenase-like lactoylglutathione lyase family enzyme
MPSETIPVLRVTDADRACEWYGRLGFEREWEHRFEPSLPAFVALVRDHGTRVFLSEHAGDASPDGLVYLRVPDVEVVAQEFDVEATEQPWGPEVRLADPDGNRVRVGELRA